MYADALTGSMQRAIDETERRRTRQMQHNKAHGITPRGVEKKVRDILQVASEVPKGRGRGARKTAQKSAADVYSLPPNPTPQQVFGLLDKMEKAMFEYARGMEFEKAAEVRDRIAELRQSGYGL